MNWSVEVMTLRKPDENMKVIFSMVPREEITSYESEAEFWKEIERKLNLKAENYRLPVSAVRSYIRDARKNLSNEVALVVHY